MQHLATCHPEVMPNFILGIDLGTTSVKAVLLAAGCRTVAAGHSEPTAADVSDDRGIKVSCSLNFPPQLRELNTAQPLSHLGERAGPRSDNKRCEPMLGSATRRQIAACQQGRPDGTDARGSVLEGEQR